MTIIIRYIIKADKETLLNTNDDHDTVWALRNLPLGPPAHIMEETTAFPP
jgi:hypothetical protein